MPPSSVTASSSCGASLSLVLLLGAPQGGAALAPYKRFAAGKTLAQGRFTRPEQVKAFRVPTRHLPCGRMKEASKRLEFEYAAVLRDRIIELRGQS